MKYRSSRDLQERGHALDEAKAWLPVNSFVPGIAVRNESGLHRGVAIVKFVPGITVGNESGFHGRGVAIVKFVPGIAVRSESGFHGRGVAIVKFVPGIPGTRRIGHSEQTHSHPHHSNFHLNTPLIANAPTVCARQTSVREYMYWSGRGNVNDSYGIISRCLT
jgi:hypothetical protein